MQFLLSSSIFQKVNYQLGVPSYMSYTRPFNIFYNKKTRTFTTDFSVNWTETAQYTWYVNGQTGNDANAGTSPASPLQKISTAILKTGAGIHRIYVEGNQEYTYDIGWGANVAPSSHTKTYVQARNGRVICGARIATPTWTNTVGNEYTFTKAVGTAYSGMVRDKKYPVKDLAAKYYLSYETAGDDIVYTKATSNVFSGIGSSKTYTLSFTGTARVYVSGVPTTSFTQVGNQLTINAATGTNNIFVHEALTAGQYAFDTNLMVIRCSDDRTPDSDITVELLLNGGKHGFGDIYVTGFDFSGNVPFNLNMGTKTQVSVLEDCTFKYGFQTTGGTNSFVYNNVGTVILNRCAAALGKADNFNFHTISDKFNGTNASATYTLSSTDPYIIMIGGVVQDPSTYTQVGNQLTITAPTGTNNITGYPVVGGAKAFGIDCVSRKAGLDGASNDNCHTMHESMAGDWINLNCYGATGPTINNIDHTQVAYYGGSSGGTTAILSGNNAFNAGTTGVGKMFVMSMLLDTAVNGGNRTNVGTGATLYYFDTEVTPSLGTGGTRIQVNIYGEAA